MFEGYIKTFQYKQRYPDTLYFRRNALALKPHLGTDWLLPVGTAVPAPANGTIKHVVSKALGNCVYFYDEFGVLTRFAHNSSFVAAEGSVKEGDTMALSGNSGISTAPHCHVDCWKGGVFTGNIEDTIDPEKYWDSPIRVKILYTESGDISRLDAILKWYRPYVRMQFDYEKVPERLLKKTVHGKYFEDYGVQMSYIPYADGYDICVLLTPQMEGTGLFGYHDMDDFFGIRFCAIMLDYDRKRKENDADLPDGMIEGTLAHELSHAFARMLNKKWAGNDKYDEEMLGYDNTHYFDYTVDRLVDFVATFDSRRMRRNQNDLMFKYNTGGTTKVEPPHEVNAVYRNWENTFFAQYADGNWLKIDEVEFKRSKSKGVKSYVISNRGVRWIVANSSIKHDFDILGIRATEKGSIARQIMLKSLGWSEHIPMGHLTQY